MKQIQIHRKENQIFRNEIQAGWNKFQIRRNEIQIQKPSISLSESSLFNELAPPRPEEPRAAWRLEGRSSLHDRRRRLDHAAAEWALPVRPVDRRSFGLPFRFLWPFEASEWLAPFLRSRMASLMRRLRHVRPT